MYEELIQRLENAAGGPEGIQMAHDAAAAIASLQTENAEKDKRLEAKEAIIRLHEPTMGILSAQRDEAIHRMEAAEAALSRVKTERDAALADISHICATCGQFEDGMCPVLAYKDYPKDCGYWQWRGAQGGGVRDA